MKISEEYLYNLLRAASKNPSIVGDIDLAEDEITPDESYVRLFASAPLVLDALRDMVRLIDKHGDKHIKAHATRILTARSILKYSGRNPLKEGTHE